MKTGKQVGFNSNVAVFEHPDDRDVLIVVPRGSNEGTTVLRDVFLSRPNTSLVEASGEPVSLSKLHNILSPKRKKLKSGTSNIKSLIIFSENENHLL